MFVSNVFLTTLVLVLQGCSTPSSLSHTLSILVQPWCNVQGERGWCLCLCKCVIAVLDCNWLDVLRSRGGRLVCCGSKCRNRPTGTWGLQGILGNYNETLSWEREGCGGEKWRIGLWIKKQDFKKAVEDHWYDDEMEKTIFFKSAHINRYSCSSIVHLAKCQLQSLVRCSENRNNGFKLQRQNKTPWMWSNKTSIPKMVQAPCRTGEHKYNITVFGIQTTVIYLSIWITFTHNMSKKHFGKLFWRTRKCHRQKITLVEGCIFATIDCLTWQRNQLIFQ